MPERPTNSQLKTEDLDKKPQSRPYFRFKIPKMLPIVGGLGCYMVQISGSQWLLTILLRDGDN